MLFLWDVYRHQLVDLLLFFDSFGILLLADFAKKLFKVVMGESCDFFHLHLYLVPLLETVEMHHCRRTRTLARAAQELPETFRFLQHAIPTFALYRSIWHGQHLRFMDDPVN